MPEQGDQSSIDLVLRDAISSAKTLHHVEEPTVINWGLTMPEVEVGKAKAYYALRQKFQEVLEDATSHRARRNLRKVVGPRTQATLITPSMEGAVTMDPRHLESSPSFGSHPVEVDQRHLDNAQLEANAANMPVTNIKDNSSPFSENAAATFHSMAAGFQTAFGMDATEHNMKAAEHRRQAEIAEVRENITATATEAAAKAKEKRML